MPYREPENPVFNSNSKWVENKTIKTIRRWILNPFIRLFYIPVILSWWVFVILGYPLYMSVVFGVSYVFQINVKIKRTDLEKFPFVFRFNDARNLLENILITDLPVKNKDSK